MFDIRGVAIEAGSLIASAHRRADIAELRIGTVLELFPGTRQITVEWQTSSALNGYVPRKPTRVFVDRVVVLS